MSPLLSVILVVILACGTIRAVLAAGGSSSSSSSNSSTTPAPTTAPTTASNSTTVVNDDWSGVRVQNYQLFLDGNRFNIKGLDYSPVPVGASPIFNRPYGDYFASGSDAIWRRDFPRIRQLGVNTIRVYTWRPDQDHSDFLDYAFTHGIKVLATFYLGTSSTTPMANKDDRAAAIYKFTNETARYANHPALLGWTFGNEVNSKVNGFLDHLNVYAGCGWTTDCWGSDDTSCDQPKRCLYRAVFDLLDEAAKKAKESIDVAGGDPKLMTTAFADADGIIQYLTEYDSQILNVDAWGFNLYRGKDFGQGDDDVLTNWYQISNKPLIVTEYGVDAYNDYCGVCTADNCASPCYNGVDNPPDGYGEDENSQADWDGALTQLLIDHWDDGTLGGFIMSWVDEYWKNAVAVAGCEIQFGQAGFSDAACQRKAHVNCPYTDASSDALCGYWHVGSTYDDYVNEGWYGLNRVRSGFSGEVDSLEPREAFYTIQKLYGGNFYLGSINPLWKQAWLILGITLIVMGTVPLIIFEIQLMWRRRSGQLETGGVGAGYTIPIEEESPLRRTREFSSDDE
eukprot:TRINITY_DN977_c2_g1_i1.p1 TRINITY_DN977_c2_g1~~TRINITY_DN977_c2_g1_i1.p1  ORF type:complete len:566 (-),score=143.86 TRINITY_DN977_c2_g1_i1:90-1787(-)